MKIKWEEHKSAHQQTIEYVCVYKKYRGCVKRWKEDMWRAEISGPNFSSTLWAMPSREEAQAWVAGQMAMLANKYEDDDNEEYSGMSTKDSDIVYEKI